jgi:hypothetical protein
VVAATTVSEEEHVSNTRCSCGCNALLFEAHLTRIGSIALKPKIFRPIDRGRLGGAWRHMKMRASELIYYNVYY